MKSRRLFSAAKGLLLGSLLSLYILPESKAVIVLDNSNDGAFPANTNTFMYTGAKLGLSFKTGGYSLGYNIERVNVALKNYNTTSMINLYLYEALGSGLIEQDKPPMAVSAVQTQGYPLPIYQRFEGSDILSISSQVLKPSSVYSLVFSGSIALSLGGAYSSAHGFSSVALTGHGNQDLRPEIWTIIDTFNNPFNALQPQMSISAVKADPVPLPLPVSGIACLLPWVSRMKLLSKRLVASQERP